MRTLPRLFVFVIGSVLLGQQVPPSLFNGLAWRMIGPFRGGRSVAVSGAQGGGSSFYFGSVNGGVWKTTDAGTVWAPIFDDQPIASIGALEVAPSNPNILYAGTGESDIRSNLASGDGVYKSTDAGKTWKNVGLAATLQISRILIDPRDPNTVLVAALGHAYAPNEERGVFRSTDGGETWEKVLYRGPKVGAADLAAAMDEPSVVFASLWEAHRPPWSTYAPVEGPGTGLYRSRDGGKIWEEVSGQGLPARPWGRIGIAVAGRTHGKKVYATFDAKEGGLYRSDDGGDTWSRVNGDSRITSRSWYFSCITADPNDPDVVYVPNVALYRLTGGGKDLSIVRGAPGGDDYHQLWIDPANSSHMVLGTDQGTTVSLNGGLTWSTWYNQPTAQFYHVVTDNEFPYHVYGAQQDSGTAATASRTERSQIDSRDWFTVGGSESGYIAPDPKDPSIFYITGTYGSVSRYNRRTMQSQNVAPSLMPNFGTEINERKFRDPWTPVLVFSPIQSNALYLGTQYVMRTLDGGLHWRTMSPDLTGAKPNGAVDKTVGVTAENAIERGYGVVYAIAPSPLLASEVWAGSDTGLIHITRDDGKTWSNVTPPGLSAWSKIAQLEASHFKRGEAYAAVDRHRVDDPKPYLFRTRDFGKTWQPIVEGIGKSAFLNSVREDPKHEGLLFTGSELGVYVSFDDGDHWESLQLNLPITSIRDLTIHNNDLIVATHGRSFWILDDISPLRQITPKESADESRLYKPATAIRMTSDGFLGTPLPPEEPQAKNPPRGASIDYYLASSGKTAQLEILDFSGKTVRRFSTDDTPPKPPEDAPIAPRWFAEPPRLRAEAGMHRFIWDLRYGRTGEQTTADPDDTGLETWIGPLVLPGAYRVKLSVDGKMVSTRSLQVIMDPRTHVTAAELSEQFRWAQRTFEDLITARIAGGELKSFLAQIDKAKGALAGNKALADATAEASERAREIESGGTQGRDSGLVFLNRAFTLTLNAIEGADRVPPSQVIAFYESSAQKLKSRLSQWTAMKQSAIPALNHRLRLAGLKPLDISRSKE